MRLYFVIRGITCLISGVHVVAGPCTGIYRKRDSRGNLLDLARAELASARTTCENSTVCRTSTSVCMGLISPSPAGSSRAQRSPVQPAPSSRRQAACNVTKVNMRRMQKYKTKGTSGQSQSCEHIEVQPDGSDAWRLDHLPEMLEKGAVRRVHTDHISPDTTLFLFSAHLCTSLQSGAAAHHIAACHKHMPCAPG